MNRNLTSLFWPWIAAAGLACGGSPQAASTPSGEPDTAVQAPATVEESLRRLAASDDPATRRQALARLAVHYREEGRLEEAASAFRSAAEANPSIRPWLALALAEVELELGRAAEAVRTLRSIASEHARSSAGTVAAIRLPGALAAAGDGDAAAAALAAIGSVSIDELIDEELAALADSLERHDMAADAARLRMRILAEYPRSRWTEKHYGTLAALPAAESPLTSLSFQEAVRVADRLGRVNRYDQTLDLLERIRKRFPDRIGSADYRWARASALFNSRNYTRMTDEPSRPGEPYYLAIELLRAHAYWRSNRSEAFLESAIRIIRDHPGTRTAGQAKILLSKYYQTDERELDRSARLLEEGIAIIGPGDDGRNLWSLAWTWILAEQDQKALETFERYLQRYPDADYTSNALFWSAKIHERGGDLERRDELLRRLISFYPYTYYSYRAREILGDTSLPPDEVESGYSFPAAVLEPTDDPRLAIARELRAVGLERDAARELKRLAGDAADPILAWKLADFYADAGEPLRAISILGRTFRDLIRHGGTGIPRRFWEILYPRTHWETIRESAERQGVDPWLVLAIIRQESAWEPTTVSSAGAVGLMQIMPAEAGTIARKAGLAPVERQDLFDPITNIGVGTAELRQKLETMEGRRIAALAAYNAGETAVRRWQSRQSIEDLDLFIDSIPYAETRLYVMTVTRNLHEYRRVYGKS